MKLRNQISRRWVLRVASIIPFTLASSCSYACAGEDPLWHTFPATTVSAVSNATDGELLGQWQWASGREAGDAAKDAECAHSIARVLTVHGGQLATMESVDNAIGGMQGIYPTGVSGLGMILQVRRDGGTWAAVHDGVRLPLANAVGVGSRHDIRMRLVRVGPVKPGQYITSPIQVARIESAHSSALIGIAGVAVSVVAVPCAINLDGGSTVDLGTVEDGDFASIGSASKAKTFSWSARCDAATSQTVSVTYQALTSPTDALNGRAVVNGGARGIEFEVRRGVSTGAPDGSPVAYGTAYDLGSSAGNPGETLSVRYVRTGALSPGRADGGLTIKLDYR